MSPILFLFFFFFIGLILLFTPDFKLSRPIITQDLCQVRFKWLLLLVGFGLGCIVEEREGKEFNINETNVLFVD